MVYVEKELCVACERCALYCPVQAIKVEKVAFIDPQKCVECGTCIRAECPVYALKQPELQPPRLLRKLFSDPLARFDQTEVPGRGTEEMKTNDVTNNFKFGDVGWSIEMGRPGVSTSFHDVETVTTALAKHDVEFIELNPLTMLIDHKTGVFTEKNPWNLPPNRLRGIRTLSAIIECKFTIEKVSDIVEALKDVSQKIDTVFSVGIISRWKDGEIEVLPALNKISGIYVRPNGKHNMGIGRPDILEEEWK
jgi:NAD-dependent dihydropyrimidine dehydrogenase PreA subunit